MKYIVVALTILFYCHTRVSEIIVKPTTKRIATGQVIIHNICLVCVHTDILPMQDTYVGGRVMQFKLP